MATEHYQILAPTNVNIVTSERKFIEIILKRSTGRTLQLCLQLTHYDPNINLCTSNRIVSCDKHITAVNVAKINNANKINYIYPVWEIVAAKLDTFTCQLCIIGIVCLLVDDRLDDSLHLAFTTAGHHAKLQRH